MIGAPMFAAGCAVGPALQHLIVDYRAAVTAAAPCYAAFSRAEELKIACKGQRDDAADAELRRAEEAQETAENRVIVTEQALVEYRPVNFAELVAKAEVMMKEFQCELMFPEAHALLHDILAIGDLVLIGSSPPLSGVEAGRAE